jgi:hypothetical protein
MSNDRRMPKGSLAGSGGQLWRSSLAWKLALLGATVCTGLYLLNPPWQWNKRPAPATAPPHQSIAPAPRIVPPAPRTAAHPTLAVQPPPVPVQSAVPAADMPVAQAQPRASDEPRPARAGLSSQIAIADENCGTGGPMNSPLNPPPPIAGRVVGFVPSAIAMALIPRSEQGANGKLDPAYVHNLRAVFHPYDAAPNVRLTVIVPADMNVYVGEDVQMVGGHASPDLACHYVPNLIVAAAPQGG